MTWALPPPMALSLKSGYEEWVQIQISIPPLSPCVKLVPPHHSLIVIPTCGQWHVLATVWPPAGRLTSTHLQVPDMPQSASSSSNGSTRLIACCIPASASSRVDSLKHSTSSLPRPHLTHANRFSRPLLGPFSAPFELLPVLYFLYGTVTRRDSGIDFASVQQ